MHLLTNLIGAIFVTLILVGLFMLGFAVIAVAIGAFAILYLGLFIRRKLSGWTPPEQADEGTTPPTIVIDAQYEEIIEEKKPRAKEPKV